ncbi:hypothetical protein RF55_7492 [Lasius niger]|uniref:Uncharacterized protein n=1 Tax=Lasius niger TaxID=67767 RepID=A0A0J7KQE0_LASNI|nr:hypothetical protein RF55_7492 [Lasius niger]
MGATAVGAIGINCLEIAEEERKNKAEAKGDPTYIRIRNKELESEIEKMMLEEILKNREMRIIVANLKKEIDELKCRLEDAEEDSRKARESHRIIQWKLTKMRSGVVGDTGRESEVDLPNGSALSKGLSIEGLPFG